MKFLIACYFAIGLAVACGSQRNEPATPGDAQSEPATSPSRDTGAPSGARPTMTSQECEATGGTVVGDIGDGAIHRPDYKCANGSSPLGSVRAAEGGPVAIEGSVCCAK
jgi:hypothetical protein